ncbi:GNAT family N-acetyltransferase [Variovorax guangxiensis]|uniref:GNAT family N-acetyltransferase n=1 Tax=Variovorax guangxiensis TaxID=1775474 RepID=A0A433ML09_9BURK|nr:GNAT family N-acetyltransferase [Variovorax guangxiensis]RUR68751.1 GNAT family N-acetyltransferase [Variovorax guangxiensis]
MSAAPSAALTRRQATTQDIPFLLALRQQTMNGHVIASGAEVSDAHHMARLMHRFECAEVLLHEGMPVGLLKVSRDPHEWVVIQIQLAPGYQGGGIGTGLLAEVIDQAASAGVDLTLSVLKANPAKSLYERFGFVVERESEFSYEMRRKP